MSKEGLEQFGQLLMQDPTLQKKLEEVTDQESFVRQIIQMGEEKGYSFTAEEVKAVMAGVTAQPSEIDREIVIRHSQFD